jgi:hypothetical protein
MVLLTHVLSTTPRLHLDTWHMDALTTQLTLQVTSTQVLGPLSDLPVSDPEGRTMTSPGHVCPGLVGCAIPLQVP